MVMFLSRWRLWLGAGAVILAAGYVGWSEVRVAALRLSLSEAEANLDRLRGRYATCNARIRNILERQESDATVPDDLGDFVIPDSWLRPGP